MVELIKYFFLMLNNLYVLFKLFKIHITNKAILCGLLYSLLISLFVRYIRTFAPFLTIFILLISTILYIICFYKINFSTLIISATISIASSYSLYFSLIFCIVTLFHLIFYVSFNIEISNEIINIIVGLFETLLSHSFFNMKRFKNGIVSLKQRGINIIGILISLIIILIGSLITPDIETNVIWLIPIFILLVCSFSLYLWYAVRIKKIYIEKVRLREIEFLQNELKEYKDKSQKLYAHNDKLSAIIHRDNKLIPAMESALKVCLNMILNNDNKNDIIDKTTALLSQLNRMTQDRANILTEYKETNENISITNVHSIDIIFSYFHKKSKQNNINLVYELSGNINNFINNHIDETDLQTLLADLIENAIIATQVSITRLIKVIIDLQSSTPTIFFYDTGASFTIDTLSQIGLTRVTTHKDQNGNGIGLMVTFKLLNKYNASFEIQEFHINETYTKCISICFDKLNEYRIISPRMEEIRSKINRIDLTLI